MHESGSYPEGTKGAGDQEIKHNTRYPQHHTASPHHTTPFAMSGEGSSSAAASGQQSMSSFLPGAPEHLLPPPPPPQLNTTTNIEAAKLTFPAEIPTAVKKAVLSFQPPPGRALHPIKPKKSQSVAVYYGVKLDVVKEAGGVEKQHYWMCLASHNCRQRGGSPIKLQGNTTTGATQHLQNVHEIKSVASTTAVDRCETAVVVVCRLSAFGSFFVCLQKCLCSLK